MNTHLPYQNLELTPVDNQRLANLCGQFDEHLQQIERHLDVKIHNRGHHFQISGAPDAIKTAIKLLTHLYAETQQQKHLTPNIIHLFLQSTQTKKTMQQPITEFTGFNIKTQRSSIKTHGVNQEHYVKNIMKYDMNFGIGPAGTGKTYLAVACAVAALEKEQISRIVLVRPAVEAGEHLGFLPGDFAQKLDPYFRPLYDALYEMLGAEQVTKLVETHVIEVAPLAYMRGRTLNDAFIILDEAQNTTKEQMKMFLTRIGFNSKAVITGDTSQIDLPRGVESGLIHCLEVLKNVTAISFTQFNMQDVVRHPLIQTILQAYEQHEKQQQK